MKVYVLVSNNEVEKVFLSEVEAKLCIYEECSRYGYQIENYRILDMEVEVGI